MKKRLGIMILTLMLIQLGTVHVYAQDWDFPRPRVHDLTPEELEVLEGKIQNYVIGKTAISVINTLMMSYILWFYYVMYKENGSKFSLALIALSAALMIFSASKLIVEGESRMIRSYSSLNGSRITSRRCLECLRLSKVISSLRWVISPGSKSRFS